jgi:hypothetical protein
VVANPNRIGYDWDLYSGSYEKKAVIDFKKREWKTVRIGLFHIYFSGKL